MEDWIVKRAGGGADTGGPYDVITSFVGKPPSGQIVLIMTFVRAVAFAANFSGSRGTAGAAPTATAVYAVTKNNVAIGSVSVSTGGVFTFTSIGGAAQSFVVGDRLKVTAPSPADATLADVAITFAGTR